MQSEVLKATSQVKIYGYLTHMLISIIVPTRNRPHLLKCALMGIKEQSYPNFEVHVVDDSSDTDTQTAYAGLWLELDARFKLHSIGAPSVKGLGPSVSRNHGIAQASGSIIAFCDDDDTWIDSSHLSVMVDEFSKNSHLDMYIANQKAVTTSGAITSEWLPTMAVALRNRRLSSENGYAVSAGDLCNSGGFAHLNMVALRKTVVDSTQGFWERLSYEEDRDFFWRALGASKGVFFNPKTVAQHNVPDARRQVNQSTLHTWVERWLLSVLVSQHICASVTNQHITQLALRYEGDVLRKLALHFGQAGNNTAARQFALRALAARFSFKWAAHTAYLVVRHTLSPGTRET